MSTVLQLISSTMKRILAWVMSAILAFTCLSISPSSAAASNLVVNGSFEEPVLKDDYNVGAVDYKPSFEGWKLSKGLVMEIDRETLSDVIPYLPPESVVPKAKNGKQYAQLDSIGTTQIYQDITTEAGQTYELTFSFSPRPGVLDNKLNVHWGDTLVAALSKSGEGLSDTDWKVYTYEVPALCSSTRLSFDDLNETSDGLGSYVDAISLVEKPGATTSNILANGSFELGTGNGTGSTIANWTVTGGSDTVVRLDWAHDKFDTYSQEGSFVAPFNRAGKPAQGVLSQSFATIPGAKYDLTFYSYENGNNGAASSKAQVQVNGKGTLVNQTVEATSKSWKKSTYSFVADSPTTTLRFSDRSTGTLHSTDWVLDNVSVTLAANQPECSRTF